jgi:aminopeptidase N
LREAGRWLRMTSEMDLVSLQDGVETIPLSLNEGLPEIDNIRLKKGVQVLEASLPDGTPLKVLQDPWESGFTVVLPRALRKDEKTTLKLRLEAEHFLEDWERSFHYPLSTTSWYPRHSYLRRSRFDLVFHHKEKTKVIAVGERIREESSGAYAVTQWLSREPITFAAFAVGRFERHTEAVTVAGRAIPVEFYSAPSGYAVIKEDFMLAEMMNTVNFFSALFGDYPYPRLGAVFFPGGFGQGLPTLLLLPASGRDSLWEFAFIAHETSHQWWGDMIAWRSYRDQWLSEGFAQYSGALYAANRKKPKEAMELLRRMRESLEFPPRTEVGVGAGKLYEIGPLVLGHRLSSNRSRGAYGLIYNKGALVLRMLHFLFTDPVSGDDEAFYNMMKAFVQAHRNGWASTESFMAVASEHFARAPLGKKYSLKNLDWFMRQWVYDAGMPRYRLEYRIEPDKRGSFVLTGTLHQEGVPETWFMPIPLVLEYDRDRIAQGTIHAFGPRTAVRIPLAGKPRRVRLDPHRWVLSENTSEQEK